MSGGEWNYFYLKVMEAASALQQDRTIEEDLVELTDEQKIARHKFGDHLVKVAEALRAIEWVDGGDSSTPHDIQKINKLFDP